MWNQLMITAALRVGAKRRFDIGEIGKRGGYWPPLFCASVVVTQIADTPYTTYSLCSFFSLLVPNGDMQKRLLEGWMSI